MKNLITFLVAFALAIICNAQFINIPLGTKPVIDGVFATNEWDDAGQADIYVQTGWTVTVFYKHSDTSMYFAFTDVKGVYGERYPDVMLDINNDKSTVWSADDWWLHASYNDCEGNGAYNIWSSCQPTHPGWSANNFPLTAPGIIEIEITYDKLGIAPSSGDTIGIALEVSDTYTKYHYYPSTATIGNPSTWTNAVLSATSSIPEENWEKTNINVFPNPSSNFTRFSFSTNNNESLTLSIFNSSGQLIQTTENIIDHEVNIDNKDLAKGLFFYKLQNNNGRSAQGKFIIN